MNIKPYSGKILVLPLPKREEKIGNVVIAATANADLREGKVAAVSADLENVFKEGDLILYPETCGQTQWVNGTQYLWLRGGDEIWGIVTEDRDHVAPIEEKFDLTSAAKRMMTERDNLQ